jgi:hypothetical protein
MATCLQCFKGEIGMGTGAGEDQHRFDISAPDHLVVIRVGFLRPE